MLGHDVNYTADGVQARGYMVADSTRCNASSPCPAVMVIQDWNGLNDYEKRRAELIAAMGYVAFAADIYGIDTPTLNISDWIKASAMHGQNATKYMRKIYDAFQTLIDQPHVDPTRLAAIGYCFGGTGVINLAVIGNDHTTYQGVPPGAKLLGVVGYHAGYTASQVMALQQGAGGDRPRVLVMSGATDIMNLAEDMYVLEQALDNASTTYEVQRYGSSVQHSFTDWNANNPPGNVYNELADLRSWESTKRFFKEIFSGDPFRGPATVGVCSVSTSSSSPTSSPSLEPDLAPIDSERDIRSAASTTKHQLFVAFLALLGTAIACL